ncbi:MAG: hypothetical protein KDK26_05495 [Roseivivax sp.]|nr:hypothetical protein [Roseivivax sp.]
MTYYSTFSDPEREKYWERLRKKQEALIAERDADRDMDLARQRFEANQNAEPASTPRSIDYWDGSADRIIALCKDTKPTPPAPAAPPAPPAPAAAGPGGDPCGVPLPLTPEEKALHNQLFGGCTDEEPAIKPRPTPYDLIVMEEGEIYAKLDDPNLPPHARLIAERRLDKLRADTPKAIAEDDEWRRRNEIDAWRKTPVGKEKRNAARRKKRTESNAEIAALSDEERKERKRAQKCEHMRRKRAEAAELKSKSG